MKNRPLVVVIVGIACFLGGTMIPTAQTEPQPAVKAQVAKYVIVNCMKVKPGKYSQSMQMEREWKPIEQAYINAGKRASWAVYGYQFNPGTNAGCDYVTVDAFGKWGELEDQYPDFPNVFKKIYPDKNFNEFMQASEATHEIAHQNVMVLIDHAE